MEIRVDKCHSFSKQVLPKLYIKNELIRPIKIEEEFKYLGRYFNFSMDNKTHKELVVDQTKDIFAKIDALPLQPKNKIMLYSRYPLSKVSWHLTVADLTKTWVEENLDSLYTYYLRLWLQIPPCGTLSNLCQNKSKFGLNVISFSTKHTQCQTVLRNFLSKSPNENLKYIHKDTSNHVNIQYDRFRSTREVLKKKRDDESNRITNELMSSGLVLRSMWNFSLSTARKYWYTAFENMPKNIYNFTMRVNNTPPTMKNMKMWKKLYSSDCKFCQQTQTLGHVVDGCIREGRYSWRHDSIIVNMAKFITALKNVQVFADFDQYTSPSMITGEDLRPDLVVVHQSKDIYVLELTVGFEPYIQKNAARTYEKYETVLEELKLLYNGVTFINLSMGACGVIGASAVDFPSMLTKLGCEKKQLDYLMAKLCNICLRCTYYIFCMRDQPWQSPELLQW